MQKSKTLLSLTVLITVPAYGGWWTNYDNEDWCHRVGESMYCLPAEFELHRIDDKQLSFQMKQHPSPSIFAKYLGNDTVEEVLAPSNVPEGAVVRSDTYVNGLRVIHRVLSEADHGMLVVLIVFPDDSVVSMFSGDETALESAVSAFILPKDTK